MVDRNCNLVNAKCRLCGGSVEVEVHADQSNVRVMARCSKKDCWTTVVYEAVAAIGHYLQWGPK